MNRIFKPLILFLGVSGIAVNAAMFTALVGIERKTHTQIRTIDGIDNAFGMVDPQDGFWLDNQFLIQTFDVLLDKLLWQKPIARLNLCSAPLELPIQVVDGGTLVLFLGSLAASLWVNFQNNSLIKKE